MISLSAFISEYIGKTGVGNTPQNMGECVGLTSLWQDNLGVPHEYGNAKDLLANADTDLYDVIYNDPNDLTQFPVAGDQLVWDETWGNGDGHTALTVTASGSSFTSFEQNDINSEDPNGACEILQHNFDGVVGWLHLKAGYPKDVSVDSGTFEELVHNSTVTDNLNDYLGLPHNSDWITIKGKLDSLVTKPIDNTTAQPTDNPASTTPANSAGNGGTNTPPSNVGTTPATPTKPADSTGVPPNGSTGTNLKHIDYFVNFVTMVLKALRLKK